MKKVICLIVILCVGLKVDAQNTGIANPVKEALWEKKSNGWISRWVTKRIIVDGWYKPTNSGTGEQDSIYVEIIENEIDRQKFQIMYAEGQYSDPNRNWMNLRIGSKLWFTAQEYSSDSTDNFFLWKEGTDAECGNAFKMRIPLTAHNTAGKVAEVGLTKDSEDSKDSKQEEPSPPSEGERNRIVLDANSLLGSHAGSGQGNSGLGSMLYRHDGLPQGVDGQLAQPMSRSYTPQLVRVVYEKESWIQRNPITATVIGTAILGLITAVVANNWPRSKPARSYPSNPPFEVPPTEPYGRIFLGNQVVTPPLIQNVGLGFTLSFN